MAPLLHGPNSNLTCLLLPSLYSPVQVSYERGVSETPGPSFLKGLLCRVGAVLILMSDV